MRAAAASGQGHKCGSSPASVGPVHQAVANTTDSAYGALQAKLTQSLTQARDVNGQSVVIDEVSFIPKRSQQFFAAHNTALRLQEPEQKLRLGTGQQNLFPLVRGGKPLHVQMQASVAQYTLPGLAGVLAVRAPQMGTNFRSHYFQVERLDDIIISPILNSTHLVNFIRARANENYRNSRNGTDLPAPVKAVVPRQINVQQNQISSRLAELHLQIIEAGRHNYTQTLPTKVFCQVASQPGLILDQENGVLEVIVLHL